MNMIHYVCRGHTRLGRHAVADSGFMQRRWHEVEMVGGTWWRWWQRRQPKMDVEERGNEKEKERKEKEWDGF
jgi:hypothetical protein